MSNGTANLFRKAADRIDEEGWIQLDWFKYTGKRSGRGECLVQALGLATNPSRRGERIMKLHPALSGPLLKELGLQPSSNSTRHQAEALMMWNDDESRMKSEVTGLLRRVANALDAQDAATFYTPEHRDSTSAETTDNGGEGFTTKELVDALVA